MVNWELLRNAISEVIRTNDNQEITGQVLQQALLNIINTTEKATAEINDEIYGYARVFSSKSESSYTRFDIQLKPGNYRYEVVNSGDVVALKDAADNAVRFMARNTSGEIELSADEVSRITQIVFYRGQVTLERIESTDLSILEKINAISSKLLQDEEIIQAIQTQISSLDPSIGTKINSIFEEIYGYDVTIQATSETAYSFIPFLVSKAGSYKYEITNSGDRVNFQDASSNVVVSLERNSSGTVNFSESDVARITKIVMYKGAIRLYKTEKGLKDTVSDNSESIELLNQQIGGYNQTFDYSLNYGYQFIPVSLKAGYYEYTASGNEDYPKLQDDNGNTVIVIRRNESNNFELSENDAARITKLVMYKGSVTIKAPQDGLTNKNRVFYCGPTRQYTTLKSAIEEATKYMDSTLYVDPGVYDLVSEFGVSWFDNLTESSPNFPVIGLVLKNRIHIVFSTNSIVKSHYAGTNQYAQYIYSPFNMGEFGGTLENLNIECSRCRYVVHDEMAGHIKPYSSKYLNCNMKLDNSNNVFWPRSTCIGGGLGASGEVIVEGCIFSTDQTGEVEGRGGVYYHNFMDSSITNLKSSVIIRDNYFITGCVQIDDDRTGADPNRPTTFIVTNNRMHKYAGTNDEGIFDLNLTNPDSRLYAWNNKVIPLS